MDRGFGIPIISHYLRALQPKKSGLRGYGDHLTPALLSSNVVVVLPPLVRLFETCLPIDQLTQMAQSGLSSINKHICSAVFHSFQKTGICWCNLVSNPSIYIYLFEGTQKLFSTNIIIVPSIHVSGGV